MSKWIAEFDLEDGDTMPEHMDLKYEGAKLDFHCRPMWIPVSERLPENSGDYLVCGHGKMWICEMINLYGVRGWCNDVKNPIVEAWMPLPKPYEPQESEEV